VLGFAQYVAAQEISGDLLAATAPRTDCVELLTAHAATGKEWEVVAIPSVQEGAWPNLRPRGSLLATEKFVDLVDGVIMDAEHDSGLSSIAPLLAEERRLFLVAATRARSALHVSAVQGPDDQPSRFLSELDPQDDDEAHEVSLPQRGLTLSALVARLRQVVSDEAEPEPRRHEAAAQLAKLTGARIAGANPDLWYGLADPSTEETLWAEDDTVTLSPSTVETLRACPLRWMIERHGGQDPSPLPALTGSLVHTLAEATAAGLSKEEVDAQLEKAWQQVDTGAPWFSRRELVRVRAMVDSFRNWLQDSRGRLTELGVETGMTVPLPKIEGGPWLQLKGRVDRIEQDSAGATQIMDIKTGKTLPSKEKAAEHTQLALYQLAVRLGAFEEAGASDEAGGAALLYVSKPTAAGLPTVREQPALTEDGAAELLESAAQAGNDAVGPKYLAVVNHDCSSCAARISCPIQETGRQACQ
jgi:RecB family exonuclease